MGELADVVRRLIELTVVNHAPADVTASVVADLCAVADRLAGHVPDEPLPRFVRPDQRDKPRLNLSADAMHDAMPYDVVIGRFNPLALPVTIEIDPPRAIGRARFGTAYEGGPGWVHGAVIAGVFDIVLSAANRIEDAGGPTTHLSIRYRRPTLVDCDTVFEAWIDHLAGRRVVSHGRVLQDGIVTAEAEGRFANIDPESVPIHRRP
jgi:acyl-coenzyme A thioesterase PaaI-like protein